MVSFAKAVALILLLLITLWYGRINIHYETCVFLFIYQLVEAFEVMILSILSAALKCDWNLDDFQMASITTVSMLQCVKYILG